jgi:hypothetical protein
VTLRSPLSYSSCQSWSPRPPGPHQEGLVSTFTEGRVIWTIHWRLACEAGIKLAYILL